MAAFAQLEGPQLIKGIRQRGLQRSRPAFGA